MFGKYKIDNKLGDVNSNTSQKVIDQERRTTLNMTILARFRRKIVENNFD